MLAFFRISDSQNIFENNIREIYDPDYFPVLKLDEIERQLAIEIRKSINNSSERQLLSYSKSLGVCLLKYNPLADNTLYIHLSNYLNFVSIHNTNKQISMCVDYDINYGLQLPSDDLFNKTDYYKVQEMIIDVSDNHMLNKYLKYYTGAGIKSRASPQKDNEVLIAPVIEPKNHLVISQYITAVYTLYGLYMKYGMNRTIYRKLINAINDIEPFRFDMCEQDEKTALIFIIEYLYHNGKTDVSQSKKCIMICLRIMILRLIIIRYYN